MFTFIHMIIYLWIYIILSLLNLAGEFGHFPLVSMATKVLLMPTLIVYAWQRSGFSGNLKFIVYGLFFSWLGDIFLMFPREHYSETLRTLLFLAGLLSFLAAHIQYIIAFIKDIHPYPKASIIIENPYIVLPFLIYILPLLIYLSSSTGKLTMPVWIYGAAIITMAITAFNRKNIVSEKSFLLVFSGAVFFVLSDSVLALTLFCSHLPYERVVIMATYLVAQMCITYGFVLNKTERPRI